MNEQWSDPSRVLAAVERIMRAPRCEILTGFSREVATLVPHRAAAMRTGGCPREPIKRSGEAALPGLVTGAELARLDAVVEPGGARVVEGVLGGAAGPLAVVKSGLGKASDALLVLGPLEEAVPGEAALELVARLWNVLVLDASRRVDAVPPGTVAENLAIAAARSRAIADMEQTHAETLSSLLAVLRSGRLPDGGARRQAVDIAAEALLDLRRSSSRDEELSTEPAEAAFAVLTGQLDPLVRHGGKAVELSGPQDRSPLPQDLCHVARAVTRGLVVAGVEHDRTSRVHASWRLREGALRIAVRDDRPDGEAPVAGRLAERVTALGGRIEVDAVPGWGATVVAVLPVGAEEPPEVRPVDGLHARELEVLAGIAEGLRNREIAGRLRLSEHTVKFHVRNILAKLGVSSRGQAAALARGSLGAPGPRPRAGSDV